jgi:hypothetical protein
MRDTLLAAALAWIIGIIHPPTSKRGRFRLRRFILGFLAMNLVREVARAAGRGDEFR